MLLKQHVRDIHHLTTQSTSPPSKKLRSQEKSMKVEPMDIDVIDQTVGNTDEHEVEKEILQRRSDLMDEKIRNKEKTNNELEAKLKKQKIDEENKKKENQAKNLEQSQKLNKKRKQSLKDQRKIANKKSRQKDVLDAKKNKNIREVPENCKHLVGEDDVLYVVPGDGCCGPSCGAAFLFHDEIHGPKLRRKMNLQMAKYWSKRYVNLTQCSSDHPFKRKLGNQTISFTDPKALIKFLKTEKADFIWTDSEDLAVLADLYQIKIKTITSKGMKDEHPTVNWIFPDPDMKEFAELKDFDLDVMVLYHEDDCHFSLVIDKNSELALKGSISSRLSDTRIINNDEIIEKEANQEKNDLKDEDRSEILRLKRELKASKETMENLEKNYTECEKELKSKTEQVEILKVEVKDLRMIIKLRKELDGKESNNCDKSSCEAIRKGDTNEHNTLKHNGDLISCSECAYKTTTVTFLKEHTRIKHAQNTIICDVCKIAVKNKEELSMHISIKHKEFEMWNDKNSDQNHANNVNEDITFLSCDGCSYKTTSRGAFDEHMERGHVEEKEFNCMGCDFQTTTEVQLKKHFTLKHTLQGLKQDEEIICRICGDSFIGKRNLMIHRKQDHRASVAKCKNYNDMKCTFSSEKCWWIHTEVDQTDNDISCFTCDKKFESKDKMMIHRKNEHETLQQLQGE